MAKQEWILGQPVETDTTDYEWVEGQPYIVTEEEEAGGLSIPVAMNQLRDQKVA